MEFLMKVRMALARFMQGRNGPDQLGSFTLIAGIVISLVGSIFAIPYVPYAGFALYIVSLFRMLSKNIEKRQLENRKYLELKSNVTTKTRQFVKRQKNRKEYVYFKCPKCKVLLRLKRGSGEKDITCVKCGHQFHKKA